MRTTITLDEDVAAELEMLRQEMKLSFKDAVNQTLRQGLRQVRNPAPQSRARYRTPTHDVGQCRLSNIDNIGEVLSLVEGDDYR